MFGLFKSKPTIVKSYATPPDTRLYVVGDIHGRADLLNRLLQQILDDSEQAPEQHKQLIFLGDYVDRGFHSKDVLDILCHNLPTNMESPVFIRGNHESAMISFISGEFSSARSWFQFGGRETIASYNLLPPSRDVSDAILAGLHKEFMAKLPQEHIDFLAKTVLYHQSGDYTFVHAGMRPGLPLERQLMEDLLFIRNDFLQSDHDFGTKVVHGHTISHRPEVTSNRIGIDTGAYATGKLTCAVLHDTHHHFLQT